LAQICKPQRQRLLFLHQRHLPFECVFGETHDERCGRIGQRFIVIEIPPEVEKLDDGTEVSMGIDPLDPDDDVCSFTPVDVLADEGPGGAVFTPSTVLRMRTSGLGAPPISTMCPRR